MSTVSRLTHVDREDTSLTSSEAAPYCEQSLFGSDPAGDTDRLNATPPSRVVKPNLPIPLSTRACHLNFFRMMGTSGSAMEELLDWPGVAVPSWESRFRPQEYPNNIPPSPINSSFLLSATRNTSALLLPS
eukprot:CCRYP_015364-RA/>CCRYP_015364-RA protein AED:0.44 eAED:0.71 QI:0/0/0.5/1/0/0/2/221/130